MTTTEKIRIEAHRIRNAARKQFGMVGGDIDFISCWNMAKKGEKLPWEIQMEKEKELTLATSKGNKLELTINHSGLVSCLVSHPDFGDMILIDPSLGQGAIMGEVEFRGEHKKMKLILNSLDRDKIYGIQSSLFDAAIPGYLEITGLQRKFAAEERAAQRVIENGSSVFAIRTISHTDIAAAHEKYPVASAYLKADGYHDAANYRKSNAGRLAKKALLNGDNVENTMKKMGEWC